MMESEDATAMRDQVSRLNSILAQYQKKYPHINKPSMPDMDLPWVEDKNLMPPLLEEYDANIETLKAQNQNFQSTHQELRLQVDKLIAENQRLGRDLRMAVETQMSDLPAGISPGDATIEDDQLVANLHSQLQMALQEKDSAMEMWQAAVAEVERLEMDATGHKFNPRLETLEAHTAKIRSQCNKTVTGLTGEVTTLSDELKQTKTELKASSIQVVDLRRTLEEMKNKLLRKEQEKHLFEDRGMKSSTKADELSKSVLSLQTMLNETDTRLTNLTREKASLEKKLIELQKTNLNREQREQGAVHQVKESVQMVENAMLEKDEAIVRERQATDDVARLQSAITLLLNEAGARTRQEVDAVKKQCNENISRLMEEIHALELENSERQGQIDRALREKRAVESELEKIYQEGLASGTKDGGAIEDLNRRACNAERLRDEATVKVDSVTAQYRRLDMKCNQESKQHLDEISSLRCRLDNLGLEFEGANTDRVRLMEEVDGLRKKTQKLTHERDTNSRNFVKEMTLLERDGKRKLVDSETRMQAMEDGHRHAMLELRTLLTSLQRMNAKWKEECESITIKFEAKVNDLRAEIGRHKSRNDELTKLVKESREKTIGAEHTISEYTRNLRRMEDRIREAENRAANTTLQVQQQMARSRAGLSTHTHHTTHTMGGSLKLITGDLAEPITLQDLATETKSGVQFTDDYISRLR